ncbi:unnamed protein product [Urochloa humidicola]
MRAGGCTVQQALSPEAAVVVKQAVSLARRRGNAQVTPLHVASAMLHQPPPPSPSLLRAACLRSHSHPLQCKALELCFNVALNRLPSSASPLLAAGGGHHVYYPPSLSNALVAAFKRAQAHQRRGSSASAAVDAQPPPPPVIAVKIELEQLVISILDDPRVSRVMREAGFSSTHVKANVEQAVSSSIIEAANNSSPSSNTAAAAARNPNPSEETKPSKMLLPHPHLEQVREEDVAAVLDCLASRRKRRVMVVAECAAAAEAAARAAAERISRGEAAAAALRGARVVSLAVSAFRDMPRSEAERRLGELRCAVKGGAGAGGVVVVVEDLGWAAEFWAAGGRGGDAGSGRGMMRWPAASCCGGAGYYCAVEHAVAEVRALACRGGGGGGVWLLGYGTYQSYMRSRAGQPSLESLWGLQTLAVPAGSLALSLNCVDDSAMGGVSHVSSRAKCEASSGNGSASRCMSLLDAGASAACYGDCSDTKCDAAKELARSVLPASTIIIPPWLHHCRSNNQEPYSHCKKWSSAACADESPSHHRTTALNFSTVVSPSSSVSSYEKQYHHLHHQPWLVAADAHEAKRPWNGRRGGGQVHVVVDDEDVKLLVVSSAVEQQANSNDSSASNGGGSVEQAAAAERRRGSRFKELTAENLKLLCSALEKVVPWQADLAPEIASTVLRCRSGMARRRRSSTAAGAKEEDTWLLFLGGDAEGKARVARELARLVFGSRESFVSVGAAAASSSSPSPARSSDSNKRPRLAAASDNGGGVERLYEAVREDPHRVILVHDVEQACQKGIVEAIESGVVRSHGGGGEAAVGDAIIVLSCESFDARSRTSSPPATKKAKTESEEDPKEEAITITTAASSPSSSSCFDLNMTVENDDMDESCFADAAEHLLKAVDRAFFFRRPDASSD